MNKQRYSTERLYRNMGLLTSQLSLVVLLSACGSGQDGVESTPAVATGSASVSAAQLAEDGTTTLSLAQAAAAGLVPVESVTSSQDTDAVIDAGIDANTDNTTTDPDSSSQDQTENQSAPETGAALPATDIANGNNNSVDGSTTDGTSTSESENSNDQNSGTDQQAITNGNDQSGQDTQTTQNQTSQNETPESTDDNQNSASEPNNASGQFRATTTDGFVGEVLDDGVVKVNWVKDPTARGYNVYRQAEYITTVFDEEYIDTDTFDESYYYEIQAFDYDENYNYVATGLTVDVNGTGRINPDTPKPNENRLDGYELVFSDEFNGTELDSSKWVTQYLWGDALVINSEEQHYVDVQNKPDFGYNPFSFDGEALTISSIPTPDNLRDKAYGQKYLSGVITSYDAFKFTYGYVEARAQVPFGQGLWPAFWLLNAYYVDDKPEIDIMEFIGDNQDVVYHTYHYYDADDNLRSTKSEPTVGIDFTNGYHTYAVEWLPGTIIYYVDGVERHRVNDSKVSQQDMYIIANTALGGWWPGSPDSSTPFPAEYKIDYIRAYQKAGGPLQSDPNEGLPSELLLWDDVPGASPAHRPPIEDWPEGYPDR